MGLGFRRLPEPTQKHVAPLPFVPALTITIIPIVTTITVIAIIAIIAGFGAIVFSTFGVQVGFQEQGLGIVRFMENGHGVVGSTSGYAVGCRKNWDHKSS